MSGRHAALVPLRQQIAPRRRHPVLLSLAGVWLGWAAICATQVTSTDHAGAGEWFEIFGAWIGGPLFFVLLAAGALSLLGGYLWVCKKITTRFPGATALVLSYGAGRAAARGEAGRAALYGVGAYQSAQTAAQQNGQQWVGVGGVPTQGGQWSPSPELLAGGLGVISGIGVDLHHQ